MTLQNRGGRAKTSAVDSIQGLWEFRRWRRREPQAIADILGELVARRGFARVRGQQHLEDAWRTAIGEPGAKYTRVGAVRRGTLEVLVANSVLLQELAGYQKQSLLKRLREALDSDEVRDLRFRLDEGS
jgi:Dna[CI] antecedent DciA-like protein